MQIFISHASPDEAWATRLQAELEGAGLSVWDADTDLFPGQNVGLALGHALEESDAFVVLISPASGQSQWLEREVQYAISNPRFADRIFPVVIEPTQDYPWILRRLGAMKGSPKSVARRIAATLRPAAV